MSGPVTTITRNCVHRSSPNWVWPSCDPGRGFAAGEMFWLRLIINYSQRAVFASLRALFILKKLTIKLLFNFNNFNSRLPASSQHHIKYFNPQKAHPCVIPRIEPYHASKSFDLCACFRKKVVKQKAFSLAQPLDPRYLPQSHPPKKKTRVCRIASGYKGVNGRGL